MALWGLPWHNRAWCALAVIGQPEAEKFCQSRRLDWKVMGCTTCLRHSCPGCPSCKSEYVQFPRKPLWFVHIYCSTFLNHQGHQGHRLISSTFRGSDGHHGSCEIRKLLEEPLAVDLRHRATAGWGRHWLWLWCLCSRGKFLKPNFFLHRDKQMNHVIFLTSMGLSLARLKHLEREQFQKYFKILQVLEV